MAFAEEDEELALKLTDLGNFNSIKESLRAGEDGYDFFFKGRAGVLSQLEQFGKAATALDLLLRAFIEVLAELGEGGEFAKLGEFKA